MAKEGEFTGIRDWRLNNIHEGDIVETQQKTRFVVIWDEEYQWCLVQSNTGSVPELQGDWFNLAPYMQSNLEVIGSIYKNPELLNA